MVLQMSPPAWAMVFFKAVLVVVMPFWKEVFCGARVWNWLKLARNNWTSAAKGG